MNDKRISLKLNIPALCVMLLSVAVIICRYNMESRQGFILFPLELVLVIFLNLRVSEHKIRFHKLNHENFLISLNFLFMIYRMVVSTIVLGDFYYSSKKILYYEMGAFFVVYFAIKYISFDNFIKTIRIVGLLNALIGVYESIAKTSIFLQYIDVESWRLITNGLGTDASRARTVFMHPIICAVFCVVIWCVLLYYPFPNTWINYIAKLSLLICILGTQSRSSWISFIIVNILFIVQDIKSRKKMEKKNIVYLVIMTIILLVLIVNANEYIIHKLSVFYERWQNAFDRNSFSNYNRIEMIRIGLRKYKSEDIVFKLFGGGYGCALSLLRKNSIRGWRDAVDNSYLTVLLDYGAIGLIILLTIVFQIIKKGLKHNRILRMGSLSLISIYISGFFYEMYGWFTVNILISLMICVMCLKSSNEEEY